SHVPLPPAIRPTCLPSPGRPARWTAFPPSDYYGDSVPVGLVPGRESRVPRAVDVQGGLGASFVPLAPLQAGLLPGSVFTPEPRDPGHSGGSPGFQPLYPGRDLYRVGTEVQAMQPSPCRPGLAKHAPQRFWNISAFLTCCCPLRVSPSGRSGDPKVSRSTFPVLHGDQRRRYSAHRGRSAAAPGSPPSTQRSLFNIRTRSFVSSFGASRLPSPLLQNAGKASTAKTVFLPKGPASITQSKSIIPASTWPFFPPK